MHVDWFPISRKYQENSHFIFFSLIIPSMCKNLSRTSHACIPRYYLVYATTAHECESCVSTRTQKLQELQVQSAKGYTCIGSHVPSDCCQHVCRRKEASQSQMVADWARLKPRNILRFTVLTMSLLAEDQIEYQVYSNLCKYHSRSDSRVRFD